MNNENKEDKEEVNKKIIFKNLYDFYGTHYYGWRGVMNQFINYYETIETTNKIYQENIFFDEWIEKLLLWGNKIQGSEYMNTIKSGEYKWISFLHNPPYLKYKGEEYKKKVNKSIIMNEEQLNKNILNKLNGFLEKNLLFLYVLSLDHKKNIYFTYPSLQNRIVSVYHPIDMKLQDMEKEFNFELFEEKKNIFHIGWWLRNFKTFFEFQPPINFKKNILIKNDFANEWENHILKYNKVENVKIVKELTNEKYIRIFERCCIFIDLEDVVANNVILECLKFNTPFIVRYHKSIEEYVGPNYPLYFEKEEELEILADESIFLNAMKETNEYLKNMNKQHIEPIYFNKKIVYDLEKLIISESKKKLTWLCILTSNTFFCSIDSIVKSFLHQEDQENIQLIFMAPPLVVIEEGDFTKDYSNIEFAKVEDPNEFIQKLNSDYILLVNGKDNYKRNYSRLCIDFLMNNQNSDILFSSFKKFNQEDGIKKYQYKEGMYFIEDIQRIYVDKKSIFPDSGYVFRKSMVNLLSCFFLFMGTRERYEYFLINHMNVFCLSEKPLYIHY